MPTTTEPKLDALISDCSLPTAQACFRKLCPGSFKRLEDTLENPDPDRFTGFTQFGELPLESDTLLFAYAETEKDLTERSARKAQFDAARTILKARSGIDAGIFIFRGANGAFRLSYITKIYKATKADFSHFRRYTYFVDPNTAGHHTFRKQIGGCAFDSLAAIQEAFSVEAINKDFYKELANWYFWAMKHVHFPTDDLELDKGSTIADAQKVREHNAKNLIRLLTRMLFVWFIKQRGLVPHELFDPEQIARDYLEGFSPESKDTRFYKAILQNFFFAALNQERQERGFTKGGRDYMDNMTVMRYEKAFKEPQRFLDTVKETTPFLNGGLFECLDFVKTVPKGEKEVKKKFYEDGFSDRNDNQVEVPDFLFFGKETTDDLRDTWGLPSKGNEPVHGLIHILNRYNFTIVENSPIEQEVALDPELLGKVFENLLASYNPETQTTARKQTGSFYTPRPIVDYMVDESLKAYLLKPLTEETGMTEPDAKAGLDLLFSYEERDMDTVFEPEQVDVLIRAIDQCKILDPACGSGAFPMGILQKLVFVLGKLDPKNERWEQRQIDEARKIADPDQRRERIREIMDDFEANDDDYGRKLYLIENCLYGVDIQSIATQVSKLRFFISLVVDQNIDPAKDNFGVRPLPNLETKFVAADTLIAAEQPSGQKELAELTDVQRLKDELQEIRHKIFSVKTTTTKQKYKADDEAKRNEIAAALKANGWPDETADRLARWDPYKQNDSADFFDPDWMFGLKGFDVVIGNPPYIQIQKFPKAQKDQWLTQGYETYAATADIYCLFYERGAQLLKDGGSLVYITSNKWMRAGYGEKLRKFLASQVDTESVLDFGMAQNFGAATTYTCITRFYRQPPDDRIRSCYVTDDRAAMADPAEYFEANLVVQPNLSAEPWVVISKERQAIKSLVEAQGVPLKKWDIDINYGIKTGFNDAFYITSEQRDAIIAEDPKCEELIVPLLRGRNVQRYGTNWNGEYMINAHNGIREKGIPPVDVKRDYPAIWNHLCQWEEKLQKRQDKGDHWSNLRNCAYVEEFSKPKIIYPNMTKFLPFYYDRDEGFFTNDKGFILSTQGDSVAYLAAFLNSALFKYCFRDNFPELMGNTYEVRKIFVDIIPVKKPSPTEAELFEKLVPLIQLAKAEKQQAAYNLLEALIDAYVMECYFRDHMAERDLLFQDAVAAQLQDYDPEADTASQTSYLETLQTRLQTTDLPQKLQAIPEKSPDLLGVILKEGKV